MLGKTNALRSSSLAAGRLLTAAAIALAILSSSLSLHVGNHSHVPGALLAKGEQVDDQHLSGRQWADGKHTRLCPACLLRMQNVGDLAQLPGARAHPRLPASDDAVNPPLPSKTSYRLDFSRAPPLS